MPSARKPVPDFKSEAEERASGEEHDTADYLAWSQAGSPSFRISSCPLPQSPYGFRLSFSRT